MRGRLLFGGLMAVLFAVTVVLTHNLFTAQFPGQNDFVSRWEGARGLFQAGIDPYSAQATANIQNAIYGRAALAGEDLGLFVYPLYTAFLILPTTWVTYPWAAAIIIVVLLMSLAVGLMMILRLLAWRPDVRLLLLMVVWAISNYYGARGVFLGQLGIAVFALQILAIWGLARRKDGLAAVALALTTIKPQMTYLLVAFLLLWSLMQRRWTFLGVFGATMAILLGISFIVVPAWFTEWLAQVQLYPTYTRDGSPVWIVTQYYLQLGSVVEALVNGICVFFLAWLWWQVLIARHHDRVLWTIVMTLILGNIFSFKTATPHFVVFMLPMVVYFRWLSQRHILLMICLLLLTLVLPWVHFATTVEGRLENLALFLPAPLLMLGITWLTRRRWWAETSQVFVGVTA